MGFTIKFNWVLQCEIPESLSLNERYTFQKKGNRMFPVDTPIDLIDANRNAIAKITITNFVNAISSTSGEYLVVKVYAGEEKRVLTNYWIENE